MRHVELNGKLKRDSPIGQYGFYTHRHVRMKHAKATQTIEADSDSDPVNLVTKDILSVGKSPELFPPVHTLSQLNTLLLFFLECVELCA